MTDDRDDLELVGRLARVDDAEVSAMVEHEDRQRVVDHVLAIDPTGQFSESVRPDAPSGPRSQRGRALALAIVAVLLAGSATAVATGLFDADPQPAAEACFADQGFDITGRLAFDIAPQGTLTFTPLVAVSPEEGWDPRYALRPLEGAASLAEREAALEHCLAQLEERFDLPAQPGSIDQPLDGHRRSLLEDCLETAGVLDRFTTIEYQQTFDGHPVVEGTHPPLSNTQMSELTSDIRECVAAVDSDSAP